MKKTHFDLTILSSLKMHLVVYMFLLIAKPSLAFSNSGKAIYDLVGQDEASLTAEASSWFVSLSDISTRTTTVSPGTYAGSTVGPFYVIGGPGVLGPMGGSSQYHFFERVYTNLVPHTTLTVYLQMFFWGSNWNTNVNSYGFSLDSTWIGQNYLGAYDSSVFVGLFLGRHLIKGTIPHTADSATLNIMNLLDVDSTTASFGFSNVIIYLSNATTTSSSLCQTSMDKTTAPANSGCSCMAYSGSNYLFNQVLEGGLCRACASDCKVCYGSASSQCMVCDSGYTWINNGYTGTSSSGGAVEAVSVNISTCTSPNNYLYMKNNTCISTCNPPLYTVVQLNTTLYCTDFCSASKPYYYPAYNACKATCDPPNILNENNNTCSYTLSPAQEAQTTGLASYTDTISQIGFSTTAVSTIIMLSNPSSVCLISLSKLLFYIRYMNINYPPVLQTVLDKQRASSDGFTLFKNILENLTVDIANQILPWNFSKYNLKSTFLISFWTPLIFMFGVIIAILISLIIELALKKNPIYLQKFKWFQQLLMWDFFISRFMTCYDGIILFTALDFRTNTLDSTASILSFLTSIFMIIITISVPCKLFHIYYKLQKSYKQYNFNTNHPQVLKSENYYEGYSVALNDFLKTSFLKQSFLSIYLIRMILFYIFISYLYDYPLAQAIVNMLLNISMIGYVLMVRPFRQKWFQYQYLLQEVIVTVVNICVLIFVILDRQGAQSTDFRNVLGWIIIVFNIIFSALGVCVIAVVLFYRAKKAYIAIREIIRKRKALAASRLTIRDISSTEDSRNVFTVNKKSKIGSQKVRINKLEDSPEYNRSLSSTKLYQGNSFDSNPVLNQLNTSVNEGFIHESEHRKSKRSSKLRKKSHLPHKDTDSAKDERSRPEKSKKQTLVDDGNQKEPNGRKDAKIIKKTGKSTLDRSPEISIMNDSSLKVEVIDEGTNLNKLIKSNLGHPDHIEPNSNQVEAKKEKIRRKIKLKETALDPSLSKR